MINPPPFAQAMFTRPGVLSREWWQWLNKIHQTAQLVEDALPMSPQDVSAEAQAYAEYAMLSEMTVNSEPDAQQDAMVLSERLQEIELAIDDLIAVNAEQEQQEFYSPPSETVDSETIPVGTVTAFRFSAIPANWLELNGQTVNTADYPALAALYGAGGATMVLDDWQDLPLWGDGSETIGDIVGFDDRSCKADLSGENTEWTGTGETVLSIADATAGVTAGTGASSATGTHSHTISGGNHDHPIKTFEYQAVPAGGEAVTTDAFSVLPKRAIVKWIIKAR